MSARTFTSENRNEIVIGTLFRILWLLTMAILCGCIGDESYYPGEDDNNDVGGAAESIESNDDSVEVSDTANLEDTHEDDKGTSEQGTDADTDSVIDMSQVDYCQVADGKAPNDCSSCFPSGLDSAVFAGLRYMFPDVDKVVSATANNNTYFVASLNDVTVGYAFLSEAQGFEAPLSTLTGIHVSGVTIAVYQIEYHEFEYVNYLEGAKYYDQFSCLSLDSIDVAKQNWGSNDYDVVSGATITSDAVETTVWRSLESYLTVVD